MVYFSKWHKHGCWQAWTWLSWPAWTWLLTCRLEHGWAGQLDSFVDMLVHWCMLEQTVHGLMNERCWNHHKSIALFTVHTLYIIHYFRGTGGYFYCFIVLIRTFKKKNIFSRVLNSIWHPSVLPKVSPFYKAALEIHDSEKAAIFGKEMSSCNLWGLSKYQFNFTSGLLVKSQELTTVFSGIFLKL